MLSHLNNEFKKKGIVKFENIFDSKELLKIRNSIEKKYAKDNQKYIQYNDWSGFPDLVNFLFKNEKLISSIKSIYDNPIFYPDFIIQVENYARHIIPHQDLQSFYRFGDRRELKKMQYSKIGLYLQDSNEENPTSIYAAEGSHNSFLTKIANNLPIIGYKLLKLTKKFMFNSSKKLIPVKCGDVLFFDGQVMHSSVPGSKNPKKLKINIYFSCLGNRESLSPLLKSEFLKFHTELCEKEYKKDLTLHHQRNYILSNPFKNFDFKSSRLLKKGNFYIF